MNSSTISQAKPVRLCLDIETERLEDPEIIHCIVCQDIDSGEVFRFTSEGGYDEFKTLAGRVATWVGHNAISFDVPVVNRLLGDIIPPESVVDTLVLSHLFNYRLDGGHSLEAWGERLGLPKIKFNDFSKFSQEMLEYCTRDVALNVKVYQYLMGPTRLGHKTFSRAIATEMEMARICEGMHRAGFAFDLPAAEALLSALEREVEGLDEEILGAFPPKLKFIKVYTPRSTKKGTISKTSVPRDLFDLSHLSVDSPFSWCEPVPFNPSSPKQVVERLWACGWKPVDKTETHKKAEKAGEDTSAYLYYGWKINERNLATLPEDAPSGARKLVLRMMLESRCRTLKEWISCSRMAPGAPSSYKEHALKSARKAVQGDPGDPGYPYSQEIPARVRSNTGHPGVFRIHSRFNAIGTWTHRLSSKSPNLQNIAAEKSIKYNSPELRERATRLGGQMRGMFLATPGWWLVGTDMESAHLRIFAHLIDDEEFTKSLLEGKKEDGTDPHSRNKRILGDLCVDRDRAKTFIFSFLNGAGAGKVAEIFGCSRAEASEALERFIAAYPGLERFRKETAPRDAARGYFISLDGRAVKCDSAHHMLAGYLQNYEKIIMAEANILWRSELDKEGITYRQVNLVHDEFQTEVEADEEIARRVGEVQVESIRKIGEKYALRCPMGGSYRIGKNWLDTH